MGRSVRRGPCSPVKIDLVSALFKWKYESRTDLAHELDACIGCNPELLQTHHVLVIVSNKPAAMCKDRRDRSRGHEEH